MISIAIAAGGGIRSWMSDHSVGCGWLIVKRINDSNAAVSFLANARAPATLDELRLFFAGLENDMVVAFYTAST
jgi:hypothetical protein